MLAQSDLEQITNRLRGLTREGGSIEAAQVRLIGLDEIREAAGARWPRMRERVRAGSLEILSRHTGPEDVIVPAGDGFLIILADAPPGQSQQRCTVMREALLSFYLGEEAMAALRPEVKTRSLSSDGLNDLIAASVRHDDAEPPRLVAKSAGQDIAHARLYVTHEQRPGAYLAAPFMRARSGRRIAYNADFILDGHHQQRQDFLELDIAVLDEALAAASASVEAGNACVYGLTVHASTMQQRRSREEYIGWWAHVPAELKRFLFVSIAEIERGTPLISIADWTTALRPYVSRIWLDFHYTDRAVASIGGVGAWAAGFHLPVHAGAQCEPRAGRTLDHVRFWARTLSAQGIRLVVHGFQDSGFLTRATDTGVDFATSDTLWPFEFFDDVVHTAADGAAASEQVSA